MKVPPDFCAASARAMVSATIALALSSMACPLFAQDPTPVPLTDLGNVREGSVSPDGTTIAYVEGNPKQDDRLFVQDLAGGERVERARARDLYHLRWSPDGEVILVAAGFGRKSGQILLVPRGKGETREIPPARWFALSPDGSEVAFGYYSPRAIYVRDLSTGRVDTLAVRGTHDALFDLDWSPAGDRIAYVVHQKPLRYEIQVMDRAGSAHSVVRDSVQLYNPRWSHDGGAIYYSRAAGVGTKDLYRVELPAAGKDASPPRAIVHLGPAVQFELGREDREVSYIRSETRGYLSLLSLEGTGDLEVTRLTTGTETGYDSSAALSPDGQRLAFVRTADGEQSVHVLELETGSTTPMAALGGASCCPAWSPDGGEIAFFSTSGGIPRLWTVPSGGGDPEPLTVVGSGYLATVQWAPGILLIQDTWGLELYGVDPETGETRPLAVGEPPPNFYAPRLSPEGTRLAGWAGSEIRIVSLEGEPRVARESEGYEAVLGWSRDGDGVYTYAIDSLRILRRSTAEIGVEVVAEPDCDWIATMSPDADRFVCRTDESRLDLWVIRDLKP